MLIGIVAAGALSMAPPAGPVTLLCTGSGVSTTSDYNYGEWTKDRVPVNFSFEVVMDLEENMVTMNGREMAVWRVTEDEVVFYRVKKGLLGSIVSGGTPYKISRRTGAFTSDRGSGRCEVAAQAERLF